MTANIMDAMGLVNEFHNKHGITQRGGKKYTQVVHRMEAFRTIFGLDYGVDTQVLVDDGHRVVVKAIITNQNGIVIGSGMAEEIRGEGHVNKTSALENCETSAVGRALASIGLSGGEYASANEMEAVGRKAQNLNSQAVGSTDAPPPQSDAPPPVQDPQPERYNGADKDLMYSISNELINKRTKQSVEQFFLEKKSEIRDLRDRDAEAAQMILGKFQDKLAEFS
jgi:hypothetical protein|tara:strand:+ start:765 stop:1436 length:672 start_codon:yes stop_codon:yes gene_type:complete